MEQHEGARAELDGLTNEQQHLFIIYVWADHYHEGDLFWLELSGRVKRRLIEQGIHPCYDAVDETYTFIPG